MSYYYRLNKSKTKEKLNFLDEFAEPNNRQRKTIFKRTDVVISSLFLDLLERKTLKLAENENTDGDKLLEDFMRKKNYLESHQRNSIKLNLENLTEINDDEMSVSQNMSNCSHNNNNEDLKNIDVDAEYRIPSYIDGKRKPVVKKRPKNEKKESKTDDKFKKKKIDPNQYNIYLNKKVIKKEKTQNIKEIVKINIQFTKINVDSTAPNMTDKNLQPSNNAVSQHSKGQNTTRETNKNVMNISINDNNTLLTEGKYILFNFR